MRHTALFTMASALAAGLALTLCGVVRGADAPNGGAGVGRIETAEALLRALERAGDDIRTLSADVRYDRRFALQGDRHVRDGRLYFVSREGEGDAGERASRAFAVHFETLRIDDRLTDDPQVWVFDGRWLVEKRPGALQYVRREIAREGDDVDPLRVGEGPMPIPIGQRADDILSRYTAELLPPGDGLEGVPPYLAETYQLRLTARPDAQDGMPDDLREVRLWYVKDTLLPRMARTVNRARDESYVVLLNIRVNEELPAGAIDAGEPPQSEGWDVRVEYLDGGEE